MDEGYQGVEEYKCMNYKLKEICYNCDGFGRGIEDYLEVSDCYKTKNYPKSNKEQDGESIVFYDDVFIPKPRLCR